MTLLKTLAPRERPRERLLQFGPQSLTDAEILALLLGSGIRGKHAISVATELLDSCQGIGGLPRLGMDELIQTPGIGKARACMLIAAFEVGKRAGLAQLKHGQRITSSRMVQEYCRLTMAHLTVEHCRAIFLDTQNRIISDQEISRGTLNEAPVYPREIAKLALGCHAASVIIVHNHPSGIAEPSLADLRLTDILAAALSLIDIVLLDHLIVAGPEVISLAELGHMPLASQHHPDKQG